MASGEILGFNAAAANKAAFVVGSEGYFYSLLPSASNKKSFRIQHLPLGGGFIFRKELPPAEK